VSFTLFYFLYLALPCIDHSRPPWTLESKATAQEVLNILLLGVRAQVQAMMPLSTVCCWFLWQWFDKTCEPQSLLVKVCWPQTNYWNWQLVAFFFSHYKIYHLYPWDWKCDRKHCFKKLSPSEKKWQNYKIGTTTLLFVSVYSTNSFQFSVTLSSAVPIK